MKHGTKRSIRSTLMISTMLIGLTSVTGLQAIAQDTADEEDNTRREETIRVTGTRVMSQDYSATSPVTTIGAADIELSATLNVETLLNDLPQVIPGNTVTSNNAGGEDFATIDLRGLGPQRTLVLIDGERVPGSSSTGVVDLNSIPAGLIERIEVVTGGTSAVYGSDAIAGVVNFILKDDYEGAEVTVGGGGAFDGNGRYEAIDLLMGGNFDNGKGNVTTYASYFSRDGVSQGDYDYSRVAAGVGYGYDLVNGGYADGATRVIDSYDDYQNFLGNINSNYPGFTPFVFSGGSGTPPWGAISNSAANPFTDLATNPGTPNFANPTTANPDCLPAANGNLSFNDAGELTPYYSSGYCAIPDRAAGSSRYNYAPDNFIYLPADRYGIQTFVNYELTPDVNMKAFLSYVRSQTEVQLAATPITGISVPVSSPAIAGADGIVGTADDPHPDFSAALNSRPTPDANFTYAWRSNGIGPRISNYNNSQLVGRVAFDGRITDSWNWNVSMGWGQGQFTSKGQNNVNRVALNQGLAGCDNLDPSALLPGCVDVDIFGPPSVTTPAMSSFVRTNIQTNQEIEQTTFSAYVTGEAFELPAGPVATVFGVEYREDNVNFVVDDAQRRGEIAGFNAVQNVVGSQDVYEAYTEIVVPLLSDMPFAHELNLETGYRYSDYSTIGKAEAYKYGGNWAPTDWLRFRAIYNKAVRAPSALESFQNGDQGFASYTDPCRGSVAENSPQLLAFCTTGGNIGGGFVPASLYTGGSGTFSAANSQVQAFSFGNPNLSPETGETITVGAVFQPDFVPVGNFRATVDYYNIKLDDQIVSRGSATILDSCYGNLGSTPQSVADCQQITRDPATGQITGINTSLTNSVGRTEVEGVDVQFDYNFDLDEAFASAPGTFGINTLVTFTEKYDIGDSEYAGTSTPQIGGSIPDYKTVTTVDYKLDSWIFQIRHTYVPEMENSPDYFGADDTPSFSNFDGSVAWDATDRLRVVAGVQNLFDELPPQTALGTLYGQGNVDAALYAPWVIGRTYSLSAKLRF
ncbi:TonB-dependent receptor [Henriciella sp. AS95]|uniref:TonB-dependent receptor domain-containing protein n=1 Tax=Henriciella sp. AS95 TaxID=3135782 RepID=UPI00317A183E